MSKDKREEEFFFAPTKKKQLKKKGPGAKAKPIVHSMETIGFFDKYGVLLDLERCSVQTRDVEITIFRRHLRTIRKRRKQNCGNVAGKNRQKTVSPRLNAQRGSSAGGRVGRAGGDHRGGVQGSPRLRLTANGNV